MATGLWLTCQGRAGQGRAYGYRGVAAMSGQGRAYGNRTVANMSGQGRAYGYRAFADISGQGRGTVRATCQGKWSSLNSCLDRECCDEPRTWYLDWARLWC